MHDAHRQWKPAPLTLSLFLLYWSAHIETSLCEQPVMKPSVKSARTSLWLKQLYRAASHADSVMHAVSIRPMADRKILCGPCCKPVLLRISLVNSSIFRPCGKFPLFVILEKSGQKLFLFINVKYVTVMCDSGLACQSWKMPMRR
jgi:hypothetical protein